MPTLWPMPSGTPNGGNPSSVRGVLHPPPFSGGELGTQLGQHGVPGGADQCPQLGGVAEIDRLPAMVGVGIGGAVPVQVGAARTPSVAAVLADGHLGVGGLVGPG